MLQRKSRSLLSLPISFIQKVLILHCLLKSSHSSFTKLKGKKLFRVWKKISLTLCTSMILITRSYIQVWSSQTLIADSMNPRICLGKSKKTTHLKNTGIEASKNQVDAMDSISQYCKKTKSYKVTTDLQRPLNLRVWLSKYGKVLDKNQQSLHL